MGAVDALWKRANSITKTLASAARTILAVPTVSFRSASASIDVLRNAQDGEGKDRAVDTWRKNKLTELKLVGLLGALIASGGLSSFSWAPISNIPVATRACWFSAILMALTAVGTAIQQAIVLCRLATLSDSILLNLLVGQKSNGSGHLQIIIWQMPVVLLSSGIVTYIGGILVLALTTGNILVTVIVGTVATLCFSCYSISAIPLDYLTGQLLNDPSYKLPTNTQGVLSCESVDTKGTTLEV